MGVRVILLEVFFRESHEGSVIIRILFVRNEVRDDSESSGDFSLNILSTHYDLKLLLLIKEFEHS